MSPSLQDVIHTICNPSGKVLRIVIFKKNGIQAMVEFESLEAAKRARNALNGCDIYSGCCTLRVEYAKVSTNWLWVQMIPRRQHIPHSSGSMYMPSIDILALYIIVLFSLSFLPWQQMTFTHSLGHRHTCTTHTHAHTQHNTTQNLQLAHAIECLQKRSRKLRLYESCIR